MSPGIAVNILFTLARPSLELWGSCRVQLAEEADSMESRVKRQREMRCIDQAS